MQCINNATATGKSIHDESLIYASLLKAYTLYIEFGSVAVVSNVACVVVFMSTKDLREKYVMFALLAVGNLLNGLGMVLAGSIRSALIYGNVLDIKRSSFECLLFPWPHLYIFGGQLASVAVFVMDVERLFAVYRPIFYKINQYMNGRAKVFMVCGTCLTVLVSLIAAYLASYLNRENCVNAFCAALTVSGRNYGNYNAGVVTILPIIALVLIIITYFGAKSQADKAKIKSAELNSVVLTLVVTTLSVLLIAIPNIALWCTYMNLYTLQADTIAYMYVAFGCNSTINLFFYAALKRDFRIRFLFLISCGYLNRLLNLSDVHVTEVRRSRRITPITNNCLATSALQRSCQGREDYLNN